MSRNEIQNVFCCAAALAYARKKRPARTRSRAVPCRPFHPEPSISQASSSSPLSSPPGLGLSSRNRTSPNSAACCRARRIARFLLGIRRSGSCQLGSSAMYGEGGAGRITMRARPWQARRSAGIVADSAGSRPSRIGRFRSITASTSSAIAESAAPAKSVGSPISRRPRSSNRPCIGRSMSGAIAHDPPLKAATIRSRPGSTRVSAQAITQACCWPSADTASGDDGQSSESPATPSRSATIWEGICPPSLSGVAQLRGSRVVADPLRARALRRGRSRVAGDFPTERQ